MARAHQGALATARSGLSRIPVRAALHRTIVALTWGTMTLGPAMSCTERHAATPGQDDSAATAPDTANRLAADSALTAPDSAVAAPVNAPPAERGAPTPPHPTLSPLADSIAQFLVFAPTMQTWFLAAKRGKRLLVDIGRVDLDVSHDKRRTKAYLEAVSALSPVSVGAPVRLFEAWGRDSATVAGFADWNGRIVATLKLPGRLDSAVRKAPAAYAAVQLIDTTPPADTALRTDSARAADSARSDSTRRADALRRADSARHGDSLRRALPNGIPVDTSHRTASDTCRRDSVAPAVLARAAIVRDSLELWLRGLPPPPYDRLLATEKTSETQVAGCFGGANRMAIAVDLRAGANEWIRERVVLLDTLGHVTSLKVDDFRFKGHDLLAVLDPNGGGIDGIVARGLSEASGATTILALGPRNHLFRWVSGFAWESR